jgi:hypothetical protein
VVHKESVWFENTFKQTHNQWAINIFVKFYRGQFVFSSELWTILWDMTYDKTYKVLYIEKNASLSVEIWLMIKLIKLDNPLLRNLF